MFTGIIESLGQIQAVERSGTNQSYWITSELSADLSIDQSLSHDGVCLTIEAIANKAHKITAVQETLDKTCLKAWKMGQILNLERSLIINSRLDGHMVQGHVDDTATCIARQNLVGSWHFTFSFREKFAHLVIEKGSVCVNGVSLTAFNVADDHFTVSIIPYTFEHTNFPEIVQGSKVNIEFDLIGKYIYKMLSIKNVK